MKPAPLTLAAALTWCLATPSTASAATSLLVETDPQPFLFKGFAAHVRAVPQREHLVIGAGVYALDFPALLIDLDPENRSAGWHARLRLGGAVFGDYSFKRDAEGWFVGAELALQDFRYTNDNEPGRAATALNFVVLPRAGYAWRPFDAGFYLMPWFGLGYTAQIAGERRVGARRYDLSPFVPYAALHLGWKF